MVNLELLRANGLRAYEVGRFRAAARAALIIVPVSVVCALATGQRETCACLGVLLLASAVFLRWRNRRGVESVATGLLAGSVPLALGALVARFAPECANAPLLSICTALCAATGIASGVIISVRTTRGHGDLVSVATASCIAMLAASMGCVGLGAAGVLGASMGLLVGASISAVRVRLPPRSP